MDWYTTSALVTQRQAEFARDAALLRARRAARKGRKARKGVNEAQPRSARPVTRVRDLEAEVRDELATASR